MANQISLQNGKQITLTTESAIGMIPIIIGNTISANGEILLRCYLVRLLRQHSGKQSHRWTAQPVKQDKVNMEIKIHL